MINDGSLEYTDIETRQIDGRVSLAIPYPLGELREQMGLDPGWPNYPDDELLEIARGLQQDREAREQQITAQRLLPYHVAMDRLRLSYPSLPIMPLPHQAQSVSLSPLSPTVLVVPDNALLAYLATTVDTWISVAGVPTVPGADAVNYQWILSSTLTCPMVYHIAGVKSIHARAVQVDGYLSVQYWVR